MGDVFKKVEVIKRKNPPVPEDVDYIPRIKDAKPVIEPEKLRFGKDRLYRVVEILNEGKLRLNTGVIVKFRGIVMTDLEKVITCLRQFVLKKKVYLKFDKGYVADKNYVDTYVFLKNKIFINAYLIKSGLAVADKKANFDLKERFLELENGYKNIAVNFLGDR